MVGGKLSWTVKDANTQGIDRVKGPLRWNESTGRMSAVDKWHGWSCKPDAKVDEWLGWTCKPDADGMKELEKSWVVKDTPVKAEKRKQQAAELTAAVEAVGQLLRARQQQR